MFQSKNGLTIFMNCVYGCKKTSLLNINNNSFPKLKYGAYAQKYKHPLHSTEIEVFSSKTADERKY